MSDDAIRKAQRRSVEASARLEGRVVPAGHVRSEKAQRYIDEVAKRRRPSKSGDDQPESHSKGQAPQVN